jgi:hypothetical protein
MLSLHSKPLKVYHYFTNIALSTDTTTSFTSNFYNLIPTTAEIAYRLKLHFPDYSR